jgi:Rrf2 family protein
VSFQKSTRYALYAAMEMAQAEGRDRILTAAEVAERWSVPGSVMAKVFQQLVRAEIAVGTRGQRGGYRLARPAAEITMLEVIDALEPRRFPGEGAAAPGAEREGVASARLQRVFDEVDELVRCTYASISLETLAAPRTGERSSAGGARGL